MFMPKSGRLVSNSGNTAQWIAQASEVAIPTTSQLTCDFMRGQKYCCATKLQNIFLQHLRLGRVLMRRSNFVFQIFF